MAKWLSVRCDGTSKMISAQIEFIHNMFGYEIVRIIPDSFCFSCLLISSRIFKSSKSFCYGNSEMYTWPMKWQHACTIEKSSSIPYPCQRKFLWEYKLKCAFVHINSSQFYGCNQISAISIRNIIKLQNNESHALTFNLDTYFT